ncbi:MAG TPA: 16S rRNA (cytosine(1402)-N(4))-methyltransferase RsmH [Gammaproteobacteria bacterium]|nr:16S rRNA (cytosine(1402)-N(4))-methyltransferase RsmH [Gammaproteobacteria bacterium]
MHVPVLLAETLEWLAVRPGGIYVDATYGRGGHSAAILARLDSTGRLYSFDRDPQACADAARFAADGRFEFVRAPFSRLGGILESRGLAGRVDGLLFDLGLSSPQLDDPHRGFGIRHDGPLDMRMDPEAGPSAGKWLARASEREIADVIFRFGEERYSRRIARAIVARRRAAPIETTGELAALVARAVPRRERRLHPATRSFQALRIHVNDELGELRAGLAAAAMLLAPQARLLVISFQSLEDRIVKQFLREGARSDPPQWKILARLLRPDREELARNPRARSARLRVAERSA